MRGRAVAVAALGLVVIGLGLLAARGLMLDDFGNSQDTAGDPEAPAPAAPVTQAIAAPKLERVRPVAPDVIAQPRVKPEELQRVAPRETLSRFSQPLPQRPKNKGRIFRPFIDAAGRAAGSGLVITIAGVEVTPADKTCTDTAGREWPCGLRARTAFRSFVRGRALACDLPEELTARDYTVACTLSGVDVGGWLVEQGWAEAQPGGPYADAAASAREAGKGIFGAAPEIPAEPVDTAGGGADDIQPLVPAD